MLEWRKRMKHWQEELEDMRHDLTYSGDFMITEEIAKAYSLPQTIVDYKLEDLRLRGYDVDRIELSRYNRVFC